MVRVGVAGTLVVEDEGNMQLLARGVDTWVFSGGAGGGVWDRSDVIGETAFLRLTEEGGGEPG